MPKLHENYYLRKYYLENEQVPTQSVMKDKMSPMLANVYFKSMKSKLKVLAGLEPLLKGGGSDWYVPPADVLEGRMVMKPLHRKYLSKLSFSGIDFFGERILREYREQMEEEKQKALLESDKNWKQVIERNRCQFWDAMSKEQSKENTTKIQQAFHEFTTLYASSITKIEAILSDAATKEIERVKEEAFNKMASQYETLLKQQTTMLYDRYTNKLLKEKTKQKEQFISAIENSKTEMGNKLHDINVEKHVAIEKLRIILECQNLACQVYVALKEREECKKEIELSQHEHKKRLKDIAVKMKMQNFEIKLAKEKEMRKKEFIQVWQKKICHVVKKFQEFVKYCLNTVPEQADFFINMEKLMLLQFSESLENPSVESIFIPEEESCQCSPVPKPHPFYLFCDKGYKQKVDDNLCPKHCTSSSSQMPVIVVNKKCIYSACDNFYNFAEKVQQLLKNRHEEDIIDDHDYKFDIPIKSTSSEQLKALKLESSLMQLLQKEFPNPRDVKLECCVCKIPTCYCDSPAKKASRRAKEELKEIETWHRKDLGPTIIPRSIELEHEREPKWESYIQYTRPRRCQCAKRTKKGLKEHLPAYMRNMSTYNAPDLPNYETCTLDRLKKLIDKSRGRKPPTVESEITEAKTRDVSTQYSDQEFELVCTCFPDDEADKLLHNLTRHSKLLQKSEFKIVDGSVSSKHLHSSVSSFVYDRALSLRRLLDNAPELEELFIKENCKFYD